MLNNSRGQSGRDNGALLRSSVHRTAFRFSLSQCLEGQREVERAAAGQDCQLKKTMVEMGFYQPKEHLVRCEQQPLQQLAELAEYYKYYTQTSILYLPGFYRVMHSYREQRKAVQYNRLKVLLDLSNSTQLDSSRVKGEESHPSFRLLSLLKVTNEESLLLQRLSRNLQQGYGPAKFTSLDELDREYCFGKTVDPTCFMKRGPTRPASKKNTQKTLGQKDRDEVQGHTKTNFSRKGNRNNSCGFFQQHSRREESRTKPRRAKNASLDNLESLGQGPSKTPPPRTDIKRKIMGVKDQIRRQKELLLKAEAGKGKKVPGGVGRRMRH